MICTRRSILVLVDTSTSNAAGSPLVVVFPHSVVLDGATANDIVTASDWTQVVVRFLMPTELLLIVSQDGVLLT